MKKILAFGASTSSKSINKSFAHYTAKKFTGMETTLADLRDFELPLFSEDLEREVGHPENATKFRALIDAHDGLIISLAEHNSNVTAAFKNLEDWISRFDGSTWLGKKIFLLSTSNGRRGGASVMKITKEIMPYRGGEVVASFSLPYFSKNFSDSDGIRDAELREAYMEQLDAFREALDSEAE